MLIGSLPVTIMFDLPETLHPDEAFVNRLEKEHDVTIFIKPKARQNNKVLSAVSSVFESVISI